MHTGGSPVPIKAPYVVYSMLVCNIFTILCNNPEPLQKSLISVVNVLLQSMSEILHRFHARNVAYWSLVVARLLLHYSVTIAARTIVKVADNTCAQCTLRLFRNGTQP